MEHQGGGLFIRVVVKHLYATVPMTSPKGCSSDILVYKLLWKFPLGKFAQSR